MTVTDVPQKMLDSRSLPPRSSRASSGCRPSTTGKLLLGLGSGGY